MIKLIEEVGSRVSTHDEAYHVMQAGPISLGIVLGLSYLAIQQ